MAIVTKAFTLETLPTKLCIWWILFEGINPRSVLILLLVVIHNDLLILVFARGLGTLTS